jgi:NAD(P)-dependent dehydrogenase (short-subunit alcohol dehydrogenase family)
MSEPDLPLSGHVAIVTGATRGLGKGCALELGAAGATVYVTGRTTAPGGARLPGSLHETVREIESLGGRGIAVTCDHRDDDAVGALFERVRADRGRLDVLVNNAFLIPKELTSGLPFWETPASNWDDMIDVGTRSAYVASQLAAREMVPAGGGLIVNVSSSGAREYAWHVAYGVGKAALDRITHDTAHELEPHGVWVVSVWPGLVRTERTLLVADEMPGLDVSGGETPRFTGRAVVALASDDRGRAHTGQAIAVRDLALEYGFRDVDGSLPGGPMKQRPRGVPGSQPG